MIRAGFALLCACAAALSLARAARADEIPAAPARWVTDSAGFISESARAQLDAKLAAYERATGHQVIVWIGDTTGDVPLEDWTIRAFTKWRVGRKALDDGLALFVFAKDHKLRIEVGYGLEGQVPDVIAARIIRDTIVPRIKAGDPDGAVTAGVDQIIATIGGNPPPAEPATGTSSNAGFLLATLLFVLVWLAFILLIIRSRGYAGWAAYTIGSGGSSFWGGGSGSGGFSGGGGMGGGGGASGGW